MPIEIERKFLVAGDGWKQSVVKAARIRDGLVAFEDGRKVRVRILDDVATIAIKGQRSGLARREYEYQIPISEAEEILRTVCAVRLLEKVRHYVPFDGVIWEVDVYEGDLEGVVFAEVELDREDRQLELPNWVGEEVTGDERYSKISMQRKRLQETLRSFDPLSVPSSD
jgi:CYTH domain-containing protein